MVTTSFGINPSSGYTCKNKIIFTWTQQLKNKININRLKHDIKISTKM